MTRLRHESFTFRQPNSAKRACSVAPAVALRRALILAAVLVAVAGLAGSSTISASPADLLDVVQLAGITSAGTAASIVPVAWNGSNGTLGAAIALPTTNAGAQHAITESGSASSDSQLSLSADGNYLTLGGYNAAVGTTKVGSAAGVQRVIARIDGAGNVDTSTLLSDAFAGSNFRGVASDDGTHFWAAGDGGSVAKNGPDANAGVVYATLGATTSTSLETSPKQTRDVAIAGGNLYFTTGSSPGPGVFQLGASGLPTATAAATPLNTEANPYGLVLLHTGSDSGSAPDTMYVADGSQPGGVFKYTLNGTTWTASGSVAVAAGLEGLTGRVEGGAVQLYATTFDGGTGANQILALTDTSGFGGTISGSFTSVATAPTGNVYKGIAFAPNGQQLTVGPPTISLSNSALSRSIGDSYDPTTFTANVGDAAFTADQLTVSASSSNPSVVPSVSASGSGATRTFTIDSADTVGLSTIAVTVTTPDGRHANATMQYGVSAQAPDATSNWLSDFSDASTAIDAGDGYFIVGDDALNQLALYKGGTSGPPVATWDFGPNMGVADSSQLDLEASARVGDTIYWFGSEGNNSTGDVKANRAIVFATQISGTGASTQLSFAGFYKNLRNDLISWDEANGNQFGFAAGAADGQIPKEINGFNIEGAEFAPDNSTLYLGFRAPIVPTSDRTQALVVPVTNVASLISSSGDSGSASFGAPIQWNLTPAAAPTPLGVREIRKNADNQYLIIAGSYEEVAPAPNGGAEFLYTWDGNPADQPILTDTVLPTPDDGSWETIVGVPDPLADGDAIQMIQDDGDDDFYGDGSEAKDLDPGLQKDRADIIDVALASQAVTFTSTPSSPAYAGTTYTVAATGGATGNPVTFSSETPGVCTVAGNVVSLLTAGSCVVDADQAGGFPYAPGHATQTISVVAPPAPVVTPVISGTLGNGGWYVSNVTVSWTVTSPIAATSCAPTTLTADTAGTTVTCTSTSGGGSTTASSTVEIDQTKPVVTFAGNAGSYGLTQNVAITCTATDPAPGSGVASSTCANVSAPAWSFGPGAETLTASATDVAGNTGTGSASFNVTVTPTTLCTLTTQFVDQSSNYQRLNPLAKIGVNVLVNVACNFLTQLTPKAKPAAAAQLIQTYDAAVKSLASSGWLTTQQAATLAAFAGAL